MAKGDDVAVEVKLKELEMQINRLVADAESEKTTRARANALLNTKLESVENRMRQVEHTIWKAVGAVTAIGAVFTIVTTIISLLKK